MVSNTVVKLYTSTYGTMTHKLSVYFTDITQTSVICTWMDRCRQHIYTCTVAHILYSKLYIYIQVHRKFGIFN